MATMKNHLRPMRSAQSRMRAEKPVQRSSAGHQQTPERVDDPEDVAAAMVGERLRGRLRHGDAFGLRAAVDGGGADGASCAIAAPANRSECEEQGASASRGRQLDVVRIGAFAGQYLIGSRFSGSGIGQVV